MSENNTKKWWFQYKELGAGYKRLVLTYYIYKFFGIIPVRIIAFFVAVGVFLFAKEQRKNLEKYFEYLSDFTNTNYQKKINVFKIFLNYANSLADKMITFSGGFKQETFKFENDEIQEEILNQLENKKGVFFLTTHIGNIEILRTFLQNSAKTRKYRANIFLEKKTCKIFNEFLNKIQVEANLKIYPVEDVGLETAVEIEEKLNCGEMVFMAGDRLAYNNPEKFYLSSFLNHEIKLPLGALRFALMLNVPIYFIVCVKKKKEYKIFIEKFEANNLEKKEILKKLKKDYGKFLETNAIKNPFAFFNFYNIF